MNAEDWIAHLALEPHPEGGHYRQTYRAPLILPQSALPNHSGDRAASTAIYFLLSGTDFSAFHRIRSDELWHFYAGSPLVVHVIKPAGEYSQTHLGPGPAQNQSFQAVVEAGCWFGSALLTPNTYALVGCTVAPGFDFADFELPARANLLRDYAPHAEVIARLTR